MTRSFVRMNHFWRVYQAAALEHLSVLPDEQADLAIFDPAYPSLDEHRQKKDGTPRGRIPRLTTWFGTVTFDYIGEVITEVGRILKPGSHCYVFCDAATERELVILGARTGANQLRSRAEIVDASIAMLGGEPRVGVCFGDLELRHSLVWEKTKGVDDDRPAMGMGYHWRRAHERILFFEKMPRRRPVQWDVVDVLRHPAPAGASRGGYPTQKSVACIRRLVRASSEPGDVVIDPFMGSGSTGVAALAEGRRFYGLDSAEQAVMTAHFRLRSAAERGGLLVYPYTEVTP